jgi:MFS-type transporter involved in bile tolerance (Atg22 family)
VPLILNVKEPQKTGEVQGNAIKAGLRELGKTFHSLKRYRQLTIFLIAFLIYNDGIYTIFKMATIYGAELGLNQNTLIGALLLGLIIGVPSVIFFGWLARGMVDEIDRFVESLIGDMPLLNISRADGVRQLLANALNAVSAANKKQAGRKK